MPEPLNNFVDLPREVLEINAIPQKTISQVTIFIHKTKEQTTFCGTAMIELQVLLIFPDHLIIIYPTQYKESAKPFNLQNLI